MTNLLIRATVNPLIHGGYCPRTQWMPETTDSIKSYISCFVFFFSYAYNPYDKVQFIKQAQ